MNDAYARTTCNSNSDHVGHVIKVSFHEGFRAVYWVNPDGNIRCLKFFCVSSSDKVNRSCILLHDLGKLVLVGLRLLAALLSSLLEKARGKDQALSCLEKLIRLNEGTISEVSLSDWLLALADNLDAREELTQIVHIGLPDQ